MEFLIISFIFGAPICCLIHEKFRNKDNDVTNGYKEICHYKCNQHQFDDTDEDYDYEHKRSVFDELDEEERIRNEEEEEEEERSKREEIEENERQEKEEYYRREEENNHYLF